MVQHETGNGLFAYPRGRPGRDSQIGEKLPCPVDVDQNCVNFVWTMELVNRRK
jgi:hypothetical protein